MEALTDHLEVNMPGNSGLDGKPGGEVPAAEVKSRTNDQIRDFRSRLGGDKCKPVVRF